MMARSWSEIVVGTFGDLRCRFLIVVAIVAVVGNPSTIGFRIRRALVRIEGRFGTRVGGDPLGAPCFKGVIDVRIAPLKRQCRKTLLTTGTVIQYLDPVTKRACRSENQHRIAIETAEQSRARGAFKPSSTTSGALHFHCRISIEQQSLPSVGSILADREHPQ